MCILKHIYSKIHKQKDTQKCICSPELIWGMQTSEKGTHAQKRDSWDKDTRNHIIGGIQRHTGYAHTKEKNKQTMWKSVVALRIHLVCRSSKAGTRISLQKNTSVETDAQLTLKVICKLLWTHTARSGAGTLTELCKIFAFSGVTFRKSSIMWRKLCSISAKLVDMGTCALTHKNR